MPTLDECKEISKSEYLDLEDPVIIGQTQVRNGEYWMVSLSNGIYYKVKYKLWDGT